MIRDALLYIVVWPFLALVFFVELLGANRSAKRHNDWLKKNGY